MKFKSILLLLMMSLAFVNCKNESTPTEAEKNEAEAPKNVFKVAVDVLVKKDDNFCLLYTEDGSLDFKEGVWQVVKGADAEQKVEFLLPVDVFPSQLRLDLGQKPDQEDIVIKKITFEYLGKTRVLVGQEIAAFFTPDTSKCTFDATTGIVKAVTKDGVKQSPSLYPNQSIQAAEIPTLAK